MRLWHYKLIPFLSKIHLQGQHRECCAMRGKGWGRKHSVINYVWKYSPIKLYQYHMKVIEWCKEMDVQVEPKWEDCHYRGKEARPWDYLPVFDPYEPYPEHNNGYMQECLDNLANKGYVLVREHLVDFFDKSKTGRIEGVLTIIKTELFD